MISMPAYLCVSVYRFLSLNRRRGVSRHHLLDRAEKIEGRESEDRSLLAFFPFSFLVCALSLFSRTAAFLLLSLFSLLSSFFVSLFFFLSSCLSSLVSPPRRSSSLFLFRGRRRRSTPSSAHSLFLTVMKKTYASFLASSSAFSLLLPLLFLSFSP